MKYTTVTIDRNKIWSYNVSVDSNKGAKMDTIKEISQIVSNLKTSQEVEQFLNEILTESEIETLSKRWRILNLLKDGKSQRDIAKDLNVSLCKITRGSKLLKNKNSITAKHLIKEN